MDTIDVLVAIQEILIDTSHGSQNVWLAVVGTVRRSQLVYVKDLDGLSNTSFVL